MPEAFTDIEIRTLASIFHRQPSACQLLESAGLPRRRQPAWHSMTAEEYWREVSTSLAAGVLSNGRRRVLAAAHLLYPSNQVLAGGSRDPDDSLPHDSEASRTDPSAHLDAIFGRRALDAFVLFSSLSGISRTPGACGPLRLISTMCFDGGPGSAAG